MSLIILDNKAYKHYYFDDKIITEYSPTTKRISVGGNIDEDDFFEEHCEGCNKYEDEDCEGIYDQACIIPESTGLKDLKIVTIKLPRHFYINKSPGIWCYNAEDDLRSLAIGNISCSGEICWGSFRNSFNATNTKKSIRAFWSTPFNCDLCTCSASQYLTYLENRKYLYTNNNHSIDYSLIDIENCRKQVISTNDIYAFCTLTKQYIYKSSKLLVSPRHQVETRYFYKKGDKCYSYDIDQPLNSCCLLDTKTKSRNILNFLSFN